MTSKILFGFFKTFIWFEGGDLKFFLQKNPPFKNIFYGKSFIWIHPRLDVGLGGSFFCLDSNQKCFPLGKNAFWKFLLKSPIAFGMIFSHFQQISLAMTLVQIHSHKLFLIFGSCFTSNPASWTSPYIYFLLLLIKNKFCHISWSLEIYKGATISVLIFAPKPISLPSPLNPQPRSMKIHWSPVQIFQIVLAASLDHLCQIWWNSFVLSS